MDDALNALPLAELYGRLASGGLVRRLLELARDEDLGQGASRGDVTSEVTIDPGRRGRAAIVARTPGTVAGLAALPELLAVFAPGVRAEVRHEDGRATAAPNAVLAELHGPLREILALERTALNLLGRLSGVATTTARFAAEMTSGGPVRAHLYDTRKTTPGLRVLEKYAVRCGGGRSHRLGLHDAVLIKDNHIAGVKPGDLPGLVWTAAERARAARPGLLFVEVEVDALAQLEALLTLPAGVVDVVLLDNMTPETMRRAVAMRDASASAPRLEASGGVRLETVRAIARTGVERISAGALTHGAAWIDVAMDIDA